MSTQTIIIIFRKHLIVCSVKPGASNPISNVREYGWDEKTLDIVLGKIRDFYKTKSVRVLFTREVSYVLRVSIPRDQDLESKRQSILDILLERVPEALEDGDFDFQVIDNDPEKLDQDVLVFAPVKELTTALQNAIASVGISIEASEPEEFAKTRDVNPIVGLAMKEDIKGKDEEVLNLQFRSDRKEMAAVDEKEMVREDHIDKSQHKKRDVIFVFLIVILFTTAILIALWQFKVINLPVGG